MGKTSASRFSLHGVVFAALVLVAGVGPTTAGATSAAEAPVPAVFPTTPPATPPPPSDVRVLPVGRGLLAVTWQAPTDPWALPIVGFQLSATSVVGTPAAGETVTGTSGSVSGRPGTLTTVLVQSHDSSGALSTPASSAQIRFPLGSGYWLLGADGTATALGDADPLALGLPAGVAPVSLATTVNGQGLYVLGDDGLVRGVEALNVSPPADAALDAGEHAVAVVTRADPNGPSRFIDREGSWSFTDRGRVVAWGAAGRLGDPRAVALNAPVVGAASTTTGLGYWQVAADGGVFAFGDGPFAGSMGGRRLNAPIVGMAADPDGVGYWLVASDGGVFAFGAPFHGSNVGQSNRATLTIAAFGDVTPAS